MWYPFDDDAIWRDSKSSWFSNGIFVNGYIFIHFNAFSFEADHESTNRYTFSVSKTCEKKN